MTDSAAPKDRGRRAFACRMAVAALSPLGAGCAMHRRIVLPEPDLSVMDEPRFVAPPAERRGVYPFYCTDFCSALHQEMQGYVRGSEKGSSVPLKWWTGARQQ